MRRRITIATLALIGVYGFLLLASDAYRSIDCWPGYGAITQMGMLCTAQQIFRQTHTGENGLKGYWRRDVAGLYGFAPAGTPVRIIELSTAHSDHDPVVSLPPGDRQGTEYGWWLGALGFEDETSPAPDRFAFAAWPEGESSEGWVFVVCQDGIVYGKVLSPPVRPRFFPRGPKQDGWLTQEEISAGRWRRCHPLGWVQFWR